MIDDIKSLFEAWWMARHSEHSWALTKDPSGAYIYLHAELAWQSWCAASERFSKECLDELPDAFRRGSVATINKLRAYVEFSSKQTTELMNAYQTLPDSLNRPLDERIKMLLQRANDEAQLAVQLRQQLEA